MEKQKFKYTWFDKLRFRAELKQQLKTQTVRYVEDLDEDANSYWLKTKDLPDLNDKQEAILSPFSKRLVQE